MKRGRIYLTLLCSLLFIGLAQGQYKGCSSNERKNFSLESPKTWSNEVWKKSEKIYHKIIEHPFIQELANGSLDIEKFKCYLAQDEIYLGNYGRQMFKLVDMIEDSISKKMFRTFAKEGLEGEKSMHSLLIDRFKIDTAVNASYVTISYNAHSQKAIESGSKEVAMSALLPCMWIYNEVGLYILEHAQLENNPYKEWIMEYGNEEFANEVKSVLELINKWAEKVDEKTYSLMTETFLEATQFEYDFWDYAYSFKKDSISLSE